jgi:hypothetical protein
VRTPTPPDDTVWLRKLVAACDMALEKTPAGDTASMLLHADVIAFRADLIARIEKLDTENAA